MTSNPIEFTIEDIISRYDSFKTLDKDRLNTAIGHMTHELNGSYSRLSGLLYIIELTTEKIDTNTALIHKIQEYYTSTTAALTEMSNIYERNYTEIFNATPELELEGINSLVDVKKKIREEELKKDTPEEEKKKKLEELTNLITKITDKDHLDKYKMEYAQTIRDNAILVHTHKPLIDHIMKTQSIREDTKGYLRQADHEIDEIVRKHNLDFSKKYNNTAEHNLTTDLKCYIDRHNAKGEFMIEADIQADFVSNFDYVNNAVEIAVSNIRDHAFNPDYNNVKNAKDIHKRLESGPIDKKCKITVKNDPARHAIIMTITDNGFGIHPEVYEKMFQSGTTERQEKEGHGVGIYHTKKKLEYEGADMHVKTVDGWGTLYYFEIPYTKEEKRTVYRK